MLRKFCEKWRLPESRRRQWLTLVISKAKTQIFFKQRLRSCGSGSIVQRPIFWTPEFISIGKDCHIWPLSRIEGICSHVDQSYAPHISFGDNVGVQQGCHITAAAELIIGNDVNILCGTVITDIDHGFEDMTVNCAAQPLTVKTTRIGDNCFIGAGACLLAGTQLGANCIVAANSVVRGRFPSGSMLAGVPARIIKRYDEPSRSWTRV